MTAQRETLELVVDARKGVAGAQQFGRAVKTAGTAAVTTGAQTKQLTGGLGALGASALRTTRLLGGLFAIGGIAVAIRSTISTIADFEQAMRLTAAVARVDILSDKFSELEAKARQLGATTRFTAAQAADGLLFLARAGFTADEAIGTIAATLNLAAAGGIELGRAADIASNIGSSFQNQFGDKVTASVAAVDVLVAAANRANTDVTQLSEAMKFGGITAAAFGITMEDTAASLGQLGNFGIQASMAGTNLRGILASLAEPTKDLNRRLDRLGLTFEDINPATNDLVTIMRKFRDAGLSATEAFGIFNVRNAAAAIILALTVSETEKLRTEIENADGEAKRIADTLNDTLKGAFLSLISAIQELMLQAGDSGLLGVLRSIVDFSTDLARAFGNVSVEGERAGVVARFLAVQIQAVLAAFLTLVAARTIGGIFALITSIQKLTKAIVFLKVAAGGIKGLIAVGVAFAAVEVLGLAGAFGKVGDKIKVADDNFAHFIGTMAQVDGISGLLNRGFELGDPRIIKQGFDQLKTVIDSSINELFEDNRPKEILASKLLDLFPAILQGKPLEPLRVLIDEEIDRINADIKVKRDEILKEIALIRIEEKKGDREGGVFVFPEHVLVTPEFKQLEEVTPDTVFIKSADAAKALQEVYDGLGQAQTQLASDALILSGAMEDVVGKFRGAASAGLDLAANAIKPLVDVNLQLFEVTKRLTDAAIAFRKEQERARQTAEGEIDAIHKRIAAIRALSEEYRGNTEVISFAVLAAKAFGAGTDEAAEAINRYIEALTELRALEAQQDDTLPQVPLPDPAAVDDLIDKGRELSFVFSSFLHDLVEDFDDVEGALRGLAEGIQELLFQKLVADQIATAIDGMLEGASGSGGFGGFLATTFSAKGNAFSAGRVVPFATGGVPDFAGGGAGAAIFPMRGGGIGVWGEDGEEARVGLTRLPNGELGVRGGGGRPTSVFVTVVANDPSKFKPALRQVRNDARRQLGLIGGS